MALPMVKDNIIYAHFEGQRDKQTKVDAPYSQEAEEAVVGSILIAPNRFDAMRGMLNANLFFFLRLGYIWRCMERLNDRQVPIDLVTLTAELSDVKQLEPIGGQSYLISLINNTPTSAHVEVYGQIVLRAAIRRNLLQSADQIKALALDTQRPLEEVVILSEQLLADASVGATSTEPKSMLELMNHQLDTIEESRNSSVMRFLPTTYRPIDQVIGGVERGYTTCIAGRPNMGKSALLLNLAINMARIGIRVLLLACETTEEQIGARLLSVESTITSQTIKEAKQLGSDDYQRVVEAAGRLSKLPLQVVYIPSMTPTDVRSSVIRMEREIGVDVIMLDGLYEMAQVNPEGDRYNELKQIATAIRQIAREFKAHVFITHQVNRGLEKRVDKRPTNGDLEYVGEQVFDNIWMIYREHEYNPSVDNKHDAEIIITKSRDGAKGTVKLYYIAQHTRFVDQNPRALQMP